MKLHELERLYRVEESQRCGVITDPSQPDNPIVHVTGRFPDVTGYTPEEVIGRNCRFMQTPETDPATVDAIRTALASRTSICVDILNQTKQGRRFWNRLSIRPSYSTDNRLDAFIATQVPIEWL